MTEATGLKMHRTSALWLMSTGMAQFRHSIDGLINSVAMHSHADPYLETCERDISDFASEHEEVNAFYSDRINLSMICCGCS